MMIALPTLGLCSLLAVSAAEPETPRVNVKQVIGLLETATSAIHSYDVSLHATHRHALRSERTNPPTPAGKKARPKVTFRKLGPGEAPFSVMLESRQVCSGAKRRVEILDPKTGDWLDVRTFDGEQARFLSRTPNGATHAEIMPAPHEYISEGFDYLTYWRNDYAYDLVGGVLRSRHGTQLASSGEGDTDPVLDSPAESGSLLPGFRYRIVMDRVHGLMPRTIEQYCTVTTNGEKRERLVWKKVVDEFREVEPGVWAPIRLRQFAYLTRGPLAGELSSETVAVVDIERSRWNIDLPDDLFTTPLPPGTHVHDQSLNVVYVAGHADPGKNLDDLAKTATQIALVQSADTKPSTGTRTTTWLLIATAVLLPLAALCVLYYRHARRGSRS